MSVENSASVQKLFNERMKNVNKIAFGKDYLDTEAHECQHVRNMFKNWDREIYAQELAKKGTTAQLTHHIYRYDVNLQKHINDVKKNGLDITKYRKSGEFMYK